MRRTAAHSTGHARAVVQRTKLHVLDGCLPRSAGTVRGRAPTRRLRRSRCASRRRRRPADNVPATHAARATPVSDFGSGMGAAVHRQMQSDAVAVLHRTPLTPEFGHFASALSRGQASRGVPACCGRCAWRPLRPRSPDGSRSGRTRRPEHLARRRDRPPATPGRRYGRSCCGLPDTDYWSMRAWRGMAPATPVRRGLDCSRAPDTYPDTALKADGAGCGPGGVP